MTEPKAEPVSQPEPVVRSGAEPAVESGTAPKNQLWLRGLMILLIAILIGLAQTVLFALTVLQFILMLIDKGKPNTQIASFGKTLGGWLTKAAAFQTAASEEMPWPWTQ
ncbi:Protein of unknown function DUF4389 [Paracoccaceae bacterium]